MQGVLFDPMLSYSSHIHSLIRRARVRHSIMTSLSKSNWGLETGILRAAHNALLVSLTRFGFVTVGSGIYEADMRVLETRHTNLAARRVLDWAPQQGWKRSLPHRTSYQRATFTFSPALLCLTVGCEHQIALFVIDWPHGQRGYLV